MIKKYNGSQTIKAILYTLGGVICCFLAYLFFAYIARILLYLLHLTPPSYIPIIAGLTGVAATCFSGYRIWKRKGGLYSYHESGLYLNLNHDTGGAVVVSHYANRVTGPAYLLGQIFLAGPLWLLQALTLINSRIPYSNERETRLVGILSDMKHLNKWQSLYEHPHAQQEILNLAQMELIDFSENNGAPRFKAR